MYDLAAMGAWIEFAVRWLHVVTAIAWIGSSFYFIALDLGLHRDRDLPSGADGEEWQVHGGGFYHIQKYLVAPENMPDGLIWHKWQSYWTWMSGFFLMFLVYYLGAEFYLIDPAVMDLSATQAVMISLASLVFGWVAYTQLCRVFVDANQTTLMVALFAVLVAMSYFYSSVFSGRAAMLHLGAFTATIMSGNVFFVIIPNQKIVVADLMEGRTPDSKYGKIAKQRSTHNNYLTLPVIFLMLSNHYPLAFATEHTWIIASLVFLLGVTIRHWFNSIHSRSGRPIWTWLATVVIFIVIIWISTAPFAANQDANLDGNRFAKADGFSQVHDIVQGRCSMCHAAEPAWDGLLWAPKGVVLETEYHLTQHARAVYLQAGVSHAMPPANLSFIEDDERDIIVAWYRAATGD
jgi:uncharacterized membrane protein